ncbi:hypothetical protein TorRG33x02_063080 [Trema orientale]|uniref:Uncharacterized protein n=1 Tax=Trema orientale TaxID=63057 RepID=A0A2P5FJP2_TREOI|nr:hypothetical protein TorRG33x02_063080 [Trema orientale]
MAAAASAAVNAAAGHNSQLVASFPGHLTNRPLILSLVSAKAFLKAYRRTVFSNLRFFLFSLNLKTLSCRYFSQKYCFATDLVLSSWPVWFWQARRVHDMKLSFRTSWNNNCVGADVT